MRTLAFLILLCPLWQVSQAQTDSVRVWNKWCSSKDTMILFDGANNMIQVYSPSLKPAQITLKAADNTLRIGKPEIKGDTISVLAMPHPSHNKPMKLLVQNAKTKKVLKTVTFYSEEVPDPVARVGTIQASEALQKDILKQTTLKVVFPKSWYNYPYTVKQYIFKIHHEKGGATIPVNGAFLTKEILAQIKDAPAGTIMEFTDIKASCPECVTKSLGDVRLKMK